MICVIAPNYREALTWARGQELQDSEWFYPTDLRDLLARRNFHVVVVGNVHDMPVSYFEKIYSLARQRGNQK